MIKAHITIIVVLSCIQLNAQTLTGVVYDKTTKQPIPDVFAYLNGTSIVDLTDNSGKFTLTVRQVLNTQLVLSHLAYHTLIIETPFSNLPDTIYLEERLNMLGEIVVQGDKFTLRQKMRAFREQFLGMTQAGQSCKIINESDIQIWFNLSTNTLMASSEQPIEVINEYLGYRVLFTLVDFRTKYSDVSLDPSKIESSYYAVTTSFTDFGMNNARIKRRRDDVYKQSTNFFFRNFAYDPLFGSDIYGTPIFRVFKTSDGSQIDPRSYFSIKDTLSQKIIFIPAAITERRNPDRSLLRINVFNSEISADDYYRFGGAANSSSFLSGFARTSSSSNTSTLQRDRSPQTYSSIHFFTNTLFVDQYGNIDKIDKVIFSGPMGLGRAGDMLPIDYEP